MKRLIAVFALLFAFTSTAQAVTVSPSPMPKLQFMNKLGTAVCSGCRVYTYEPGSTTAKATYTDSTGLVANTLPYTTLDTAGRGNFWINGCVKYVIRSSSDELLYTVDNVCQYITNVAAVSQWQASGLTATYVSGTSFSVPGDNTATFVAGTRIQSTNTGGTIYSTVVSSAYTSVTTVVVSNDSGTLDSGLSAVNIGLITVSNSSLPVTPVSTKTTGYTILPTDCGKTLIANLTTAATFTFPAANAVPSGCSIVTKATGSTVTLAGTIDSTVNPTIDGIHSIRIFSNGSAWKSENVFWAYNAKNADNLSDGTNYRTASATAAANTIPVSGSNSTISYGFSPALTEEVSSSASGTTVQSTATNIITGVTLTSVPVDARILVVCRIRHTKGGTAGQTSFTISADTSDTAGFTFLAIGAAVYRYVYMPASAVEDIVFSSIAKITTAGNLVLKLSGTSAGSTTAIGLNEAELYLGRLK